MLNCFLVKKFYLHYALCDFDSILLCCTKLFIRQSIDREQIFDVTFEPPPIEKSCVRHCSYHVTEYPYVVPFIPHQVLNFKFLRSTVSISATCARKITNFARNKKQNLRLSARSVAEVPIISFKLQFKNLQLF